MNFLKKLWCFTVILTTVTCLEKDIGGSPLDSILSVDNLIALRGYTVVTFLLHSPDGAILEVHRVIPKVKYPFKNNAFKYPVLLIPGITMSSYAWIMLPKVSIVYGLADRGYDVWLCNLRGMSKLNKFKHIPLGMGPKGWHFTQDDLAKYDMPTFIDHIIKVTGKPKVHTIGYSLGNTLMFQLLASKPEYNDKVASLIAMAPSVYLEKRTGPMRIFNVLPFGPQLLFLACVLSGFGAMLFSGNIVRVVAIPTTISKIARLLGRFIVFQQLGYDPDIAEEAVPIIFGMETPLPTLVNYQYLQHSRSGRFAYFDYGKLLNSRIYGSPQPPEYDLSKIRSPVVLMNGDTDVFDSTSNTQNLVFKLGSALFSNYYVDDVLFGHMSFLAATDLDEKVNEPIYRILELLI